MKTAENAKYLNPFTDFGFKRIFGEQSNKQLLIDFLSELLEDQEGEIVELEYLKSDQFGRPPSGPRAILDFACRSRDGNHFMVEMQKPGDNHFKDVMLFCATVPIQEQFWNYRRASDPDRDYSISSGYWKSKPDAIYSVAILDFVFNEDEDDPDKFRYDVKLADAETNEVFSDILTMIYLEMPKFNKTPEQLESRFDKWMYALNRMSSLNQVPEVLQDDTFLRLFKIAETAGLSEAESQAYRESLKND